MLAVENEDYETAKKIKFEIEKIKKTIQSLDPSTGVPKSLANAELRSHLLENQPKAYAYNSFKLPTP